MEPRKLRFRALQDLRDVSEFEGFKTMRHFFDANRINGGLLFRQFKEHDPLLADSYKDFTKS